MDGATPRQTPAGTPETRALWVPAEAATVEDTWSVVGMCGTGSHDFEVDEVGSVETLPAIEEPCFDDRRDGSTQQQLQNDGCIDDDHARSGQPKETTG